jgi:hypothetical protein
MSLHSAPGLPSQYQQPFGSSCWQPSSVISATHVLSEQYAFSQSVWFCPQ